jgi:hypothetical protein
MTIDWNSNCFAIEERNRGFRVVGDVVDKYQRRITVKSSRQVEQGQKISNL